MKWEKFKIVLLILLLLSPASFALADSVQKVKIFVNQRELNLSICPQIYDGHLTVPMRSFLEAFGAEVNWDSKTNMVTIRRAEKTVVLGVDHYYTGTDGESVQLSVPVQIYKGVAMVPLDFLAEFLGLNVHWNREQRVVELDSPNFIFLERFPGKGKDCLPEWIQQWVESAGDHLDLQYRVKDNKLYLLSTFGEKVTSGYDVRISSITRHEDNLIVEVKYNDSSSLPTIQVITRPYDLVYIDLDTLDKSAGRPASLIFKIRGLKDIEDIETLPVRAELPPVTR